MANRLIVTACFCFAWTSLLLAEEPAADSSENLAFGKPYTLSAAPTTKWYNVFRTRHQPFPDMNTVLTDGKLYNSKYFWVSNLCLNFSGASPVDVVIDLGNVYPIAQIFTHHGSNPNAGIAQPSREEYYCSLDNVRFVKVGEFVNTFDPQPITDANKGTFFNGRKTFTSGEMKTKGRYVLVRTWGISGNPENPGLIQGSYVAHDEIIVNRGSFRATEVKLDMKTAIKIKLDFDDSLTGYPYHTRAWQALFTRTPLAFLLVPNSFRGSKTYHMSVGGVYALDFASMDNATEKPMNITFRCSFPDTVEIIEVNALLKTTSRKKEIIGGVSYNTVVQEIEYPGYLHKPTFVVAPKLNEPNDNIGNIVFSWSYRQNGKLYASSQESFRIVLERRLVAPAPKRFKTGVWSSSSYKCMADKYGTAKRLFKFYRGIGFNWVNGGHSDEGIFRAANELKMDSCFEKAVCPNGLMVCLYDRGLKPVLEEQAPFVYANGQPGRYGVCPTKFLSGKFDRQYIDRIKQDLQTTRDIYDNWEPYMLHKKGCVCDDCKRSFQAFANLSDAQVKSMWPQVVTSWDSTQHNAFFSWQLSEMMKKTQACIDRAAAEMKLPYKPSFIPSMSPAYVNPNTDWYKIQQPRFFMGELNKLILFRYINGINPFSFPRAKLNGNNLAFLPSFNNALSSRKKYGRKDASGRYLPKLYFLQTQHFFGTTLVLPKDYYFTSVLAFIMGFDGCGTWQETHEQEARYLREHVRAHAFISKYEDAVFDGEVLSDFSIRRHPRAISGKQLLFCRGFVYKGKVFIAVGNDSLQRVNAVISSSGRSATLLDDPSANRKYRGDLQKGIAVDIPGKTWLMLTAD